MKKLRNKKLLFWVLIMIAIVVRIYHFPTALAEMNCDEIMTVVNAKSIIDTGKDLNNISFPVYLQGWGGQSVILLYLMALSIKILGYSLFAIRFPSLVISIISIFVFYDFTKKITQNEKVALIALALITICPWHILQSIWSLDCNMFPHFLLFAMDLLYTGLTHKKKLILYSSMIFFAFSLYGYGVAIYIVPLFLFSMSIYLVKIKSIKMKDVLICMSIFLIIAMPIITMFAINLLHINQNIQIGNITIPYYENLSRTKDMIFFTPNKLQQLWNNICSTLKVIFWQQDGAEWNSSKIFGTTYQISIILSIIGLFYSIKKLKEKEIGNMMLVLWLSISFLAGLIINEANINRLNSIWYVLIIFAALGIGKLYQIIKYKKTYTIILFFTYFILFISYIIYFYSYFVNVIDCSGCFSRGFYQALSYVKNLEGATVFYDNTKKDGNLELYIQFNQNPSKTYQSITTQEELENKIQNIGENELLILDIEYKNYDIKNDYYKIGDFLVIHQ